MTNAQQRAEHFTRALRAAGVRITRQRSALLDVLAEAEDHPDAVELHMRSKDREPGISLSTVYRTLTALEERLDAHDLVLFEGVGPIWAKLGDDASDRDRVAATKSRIRLIGVTATQRRAAGAPVRTIEDTWADASGYEARLIKAAATDATNRART